MRQTKMKTADDWNQRKTESAWNGLRNGTLSHQADESITSIPLTQTER